VTFLNEMLGEFWYSMSMVVEPAPDVQLSRMVAELGKQEEQMVEIENPINKDMPLTCLVSNTTNYEVSPKELIMKPLEHF
jgi:hypothetical protein